MPPLPINKTTFYLRGWQYTVHRLLSEHLLWLSHQKETVCQSVVGCISPWLLVKLFASNQSQHCYAIGHIIKREQKLQDSSKTELLTFTIWCPALTKSNDEGKSIDCYLMVKHIDKTTHWFARQLPLIGFFLVSTPEKIQKSARETYLVI